jgi:hypothetical protein
MAESSSELMRFRMGGRSLLVGAYRVQPERIDNAWKIRIGRKSATPGVRAEGADRIEFDFEFAGKRYRPTLERRPTEANFRRAVKQLEAIRRQIKNGTFSFVEEFPDFRGIENAEPDASSRDRTCKCLTTLSATASPEWRKAI